MLLCYILKQAIAVVFTEYRLEEMTSLTQVMFFFLFCTLYSDAFFL